MNEKVLVFNIVHGSFVDGPGIRTTVFLKGCPLRCLWCCNPEGQRFAPELRVSADRCDGCGRCDGICANGALSIRNGHPIVDRAVCDGCGRCTEVCPTAALERFGQWMSAEDVFSDVLRDKSFYDHSGGGLTIGGGEASSHPAFVHRLIDLCHKHGIHIAIDTCGYTVCDESFSVLRRADLLLYDIKGIDETQHIANTGVSNRRILSNLHTLDALGIPLIVRIPVIPQHNANRRELEAMADLLIGLKQLWRVDLICYHKYGVVKYEQLGREYPLHLSCYSPQQEGDILHIFTSRDLPAQLGG